MGQTVYRDRIALGTTIGLSLHGANTAVIQALQQELWREILIFEKRCSRFLPQSELSQFNNNAGVQRLVSPELREILVLAKRLSLQTKGLFNPFILPALQRAGYIQSFLSEYATDPVHDYSKRSVVAVDNLEIGDCWARIPYGTALDLGGCGKGYIGDKLADIVEASNIVEGYWLSIGGDVVAAGVQESGEPVCIRIAKGGAGDQTIASVVPGGVLRFAVATSTTTKRKGRHRGRPWHHIIDPRTNQPSASDVVTASVCGPSLLEVDVHAANLVILGSGKARQYARRQQVQDFLLQNVDGKVVAVAGSRIVLD